MSGIRRTEEMTAAELEAAIRMGGRVVSHRVVISIVVMTFFLPTSPRFIPAGKRDYMALVWSIVSLLLGLWGLPWGPIRTVQALFHNSTSRRRVL